MTGAVPDRRQDERACTTIGANSVCTACGVAHGRHKTGCRNAAVSPVPGQQRQAVADLLMRHWRTPTSGCHCGGVPLGYSWPLHVADELLALLAATRDGEQA